jgi:hypothetical protein
MIMHHSANVGVFLCGPKALSTEVHKACNKFTDATHANGTIFTYNKVGRSGFSSTLIDWQENF